MEGQRGIMSKLHDASTDSLREMREAEVKARVNKHMLELTTLRRQAGIISSPSDELLEAEKKLAEVSEVINLVNCSCILDVHVMSESMGVINICMYCATRTCQSRFRTPCLSLLYIIFSAILAPFKLNAAALMIIWYGTM